MDAAPFAIQERFGPLAGEVPSPAESDLKLPVLVFADARLAIATVFDSGGGVPAAMGEPATESSGDGLPTMSSCIVADRLIVAGVRWLMLEVRRPSSTAGEVGARIRTTIGSSRL